MDALAGASFPRAARLLEPDDFVRALKTRAHRGRFLWVYRNSGAAAVASTTGADSAARPRLGMMIGKKNARTAVLRNAVKRRLREQFRVRQARLPASQYVVRLSASISPKDVAAVITEWTVALDRDIATRVAADAVPAALKPAASFAPAQAAP